VGLVRLTIPKKKKHRIRRNLNAILSHYNEKYAKHLAILKEENGTSAKSKQEYLCDDERSEQEEDVYEEVIFEEEEPKEKTPPKKKKSSKAVKRKPLP